MRNIDTKNDGIKGIINPLLEGYKLFFKSIFNRANYKRLDFPFRMSVAISVLAVIGLIRTFLSIGVYINKYELNLIWIFCMVVFPNFLCFFPAMILDWFFQEWKLGIKSKNIFGFFFFAQVLHVFIPLLDRLSKLLNINIYDFLPIVSEDIYFKLTVSPIAFSPLIFLFAGASLGTLTAWLIMTIATVKYGIDNKVPKLRYFVILMIIFYIVFSVTYPPHLISFRYINTKIPENDFYYSMNFLIGSIGGILYFERFRKKISKEGKKY